MSHQQVTKDQKRQGVDEDEEPQHPEVRPQTMILCHLYVVDHRLTWCDDVHNFGDDSLDLVLTCVGSNISK